MPFCNRRHNSNIQTPTMSGKDTTVTLPIEIQLTAPSRTPNHSNTRRIRTRLRCIMNRQLTALPTLRLTRGAGRERFRETKSCRRSSGGAAASASRRRRFAAACENCFMCLQSNVVRSFTYQSSSKISETNRRMAQPKPFCSLRFNKFSKQVAPSPSPATFFRVTQSSENN